MNSQILTILLAQFVAPLLAGFVFGARLKTPNATDAEIAAEAEGDVRHALRNKLGFMVDILWGIDVFRQPLDAEIVAAVAENKLPDALLALLPTAPVVAPVVHSAAFVNTSAPLEMNAGGTFTQPQEVHPV